MSCCDGSLLYVNNQTSGNNATTFTVLAVSPSDSTTISGIAVNDTVAPSGTLSGAVESANGSDGAAAGTIQIGSGTTVFNLNYTFKPKHEGGKCPCNPNGSSSPDQINPYKVTVKSTTGNNAGAVLNFYVGS